MLLWVQACTDGKESAVDDTSPVTDTEDTGPVVIDDTQHSEETDAPEDTAQELAEYEAFYDIAVVQVVNLRLSEGAIAALGKDPDTWVPASFEHGATTLPKVGLRLRGGESWDEKPGFQLRLQEYGGEEYAGLERIVLDNQWGDNTLLRAPLAYEAWRSAGLAAPRCNFAEVWVNDAYFGLYANIEVIDEKFVERTFPTPTGDLYEGESGADFYEQGVGFLDLVDGAGDAGALQRAWQAVQPPYDVSFYEDAGVALDLPQYFRYFAWLLATGTNEGYPYEQDDFYVYLDPTSGRYLFLPWGLDQAWTSGWTADAQRGFVDVYCDIDPACAKARLAAIAAELPTLEAQDLGGRVGELATLTADAAARDTRAPYDPSQINAARTAFVATLNGWPAQVRAAVGL